MSRDVGLRNNSSNSRDKRIKGASGLGVVAVPVECDPPPYAGDDLTNTDLVHLAFQFFQQGRRAAGFGAAPVEDNVYKYFFQSAFFCHLQQSQRVMDLAVGALFGEQANQV